MTVQTVRPDSTSLTTGVVGVGGAVTNHGALNDASDTTGITANVDNAYTVLGLANPSSALASNQRVKQWRIRMRVARTAADQHNQRVEVKLRDAANRLSAYDTIQYGSTTVKEFVGPWRANGPGNIAFTNTILNAMRMDVVWRPRVGGANEWLEARGAFVDFDYNDRPVASGVDLTGVTTTSLPDVVWTYSDADGDPQTSYRVKVFTQAVATAGGFDPETSSQAVWDSGILGGNAASITVGKNLVNGTTYIAYVKVAQNWSGPEGSLWWSSWVAGTARTVSLTPPAAITPVLSVISTLPDYRALHTITAGSPGGGTTTDIQLQRMEKTSRMRGEFYNWAHPQIESCGGLTIGSDGFYSRQTAFLASYPLDAASPTGSDNAVARMISWNPSVGAFSGLDIGAVNAAITDEAPPYLWPAPPGLAMRLSVWARTRTGTFVTRLHHLSVDASNNQVTSGDSIGSQVTLNTTWQRLEVAFTVPANAVYGRGHIENVTPSTGVEVLLTGLQVGPDPGAGAPLQDGIGAYMPFPPDTPWEDVRTREARTGLASGAKVYVVDHELIPMRPIIYRARAITTVTGNTVSGPWTYYTAYVGRPATTLIRDPFQPENLIIAKRDGRSQSVRTEDAVTFHANGRSEDPIVMSDWRSGEDGSMTLYWASQLERKKIVDLVAGNRSVLVQWFDGGAAYIRFTGNRTFDVLDSDYGVFTGEYVSQARP